VREMKAPKRMSTSKMTGRKVLISLRKVMGESSRDFHAQNRMENVRKIDARITVISVDRIISSRLGISSLTLVLTDLGTVGYNPHLKIPTVTGLFPSGGGLLHDLRTA
jgi:protein gp37